jgi:hypothetical protein
MASDGGPAPTQATPGAPPATTAPRPRAPALAARALLAVWVVWSVTAAGCAAGAPTGAAGRAVALYVGNARDGTITRLDAASGRALGSPLPGGEAPWQLAAGPAGALLVLPVGARLGRPEVRMIYVARGPGGWRARPVPLEPGARAPLLAGGGRYAVVAYEAEATPAGPEPARCRVALFDLARGRLGAPRDVCGGRDTVVGLAVEGAGGAEDGGAGRVLAYLALWRRPAAAGDCGGVAGDATTGGDTGSRVVALHPATGAAVAGAPLAGVPGPLVLAAAPGRLGRRLYAAEALPAPLVAVPGEPPADCLWAGYDEQFEGARAWRVWGLDATTLAPTGEHAVPYPPRALAATPDGDDAFVLAGHAALLRLGPAGGPAVPFATLPDRAVGLAATDGQVFTLDSFGDRVWSLDRARGRVLRTIPTGRSPLGLALAASERP